MVGGVLVFYERKLRVVVKRHFKVNIFVFEKFLIMFWENILKYSSVFLECTDLVLLIVIRILGFSNSSFVLLFGIYEPYERPSFVVSITFLKAYV